MKTLIISILTLAITNCFSQVKDDCFKEIKKSEWNYSICIDKHMGVDATNESELVIKQYEIAEDETKTRQLTITLEYNYENNTEQELWDAQFAGKQMEGLKLLDRKDSVLISGDTEFFIVNRTFENENKELWVLSSAIGLYKNQYYTFQTLGINDKSETLNFLCKVLNRSSFFGEPSVKNDKSIKDQFLNTLISGIKDKKELQEILITTDVMLSITPEKDKKSMTEQLPQFEMMMKNWNQTVYDFVDGMKKYKTVTIKNYDFKRDNSQPNMTGYMALINFDCDGQDIGYRLVCMEIDGLMYLGKMVKNNQEGQTPYYLYIC
jgi:hypothetical protein